MDDLYELELDHVLSSSHEITNDASHAASAVESLDQTPAVIDDAAHSSTSDVIKAEIVCHPLYPDLISAYLDCKKLCAPPEIVSLLEEIELGFSAGVRNAIGVNPELDEFMESYSEILRRHKDEFLKSINEAKSYIASIEAQLSSLCHSTDGSYQSDDADEIRSEEAELVEVQDSSVELRGDLQWKQELLQKYRGCLNSLRTEFLKSRRKCKLPKDARSVLMEWWNSHRKWPYPTEEEKRRLSGMTGLETKQINNWFINQRKRHWKPSEELRVAGMDGGAVSASGF